ncbi:50S ribosomal protein L35 [Candidatus Tremblaya phenacola]|uniref:50S ribosomal protein L35 n=1 Tax=Candidatus Tremblayella phenacoccinincola TaxID=1010676 RepID=UPI001330FB97|nr:50S ribosomal protein L35 [Candidatus Tremblaya phenacola]
MHKTKPKPNRSAAKRFKCNKTGCIKKRKAFRNHLLTKKRSKNKRRLHQGSYVHISDSERIRRMLWQ